MAIQKIKVLCPIIQKSKSYAQNNSMQILLLILLLVQEVFFLIVRQGVIKETEKNKTMDIKKISLFISIVGRDAKLCPPGLDSKR